MTPAASAGNGMRTSFCYFAFGLRIEAEFALPELAPFACAPSPDADVTIRLGSVSLPQDADQTHLWCEADSTGLAIDRTARYLVRGEREIIVDPFPEASQLNVRLFLLGSAFGILFHRRALVPLHANAIVVDGEAVAFAGRTGIGKSTLAAYFQSRGYDVLCDDVCVVGFDERQRPHAWPGLPRLKLWRDAAETFGHDSERLERAVEGLEKFHVPLAASSLRGPYPLSRIYILANCAEGELPQIVGLNSKEALQAVMTNTYRKMYLPRLGLTRRNFLMAADIVRRTAVFSARRRRGFDVFDDEAARLARHFSTKAAANDVPDALNAGGAVT